MIFESSSVEIENLILTVAGSATSAMVLLAEHTSSRI